MATPEEIDVRLQAVQRLQETQAHQQAALLEQQNATARLYTDLKDGLPATVSLVRAVHADQAHHVRLLQTMETELLDHRERLGRLEAVVTRQGERLEAVGTGVQEILTLLKGGATGPA